MTRGTGVYRVNKQQFNQTKRNADECRSTSTRSTLDLEPRPPYSPLQSACCALHPIVQSRMRRIRHPRPHRPWPRHTRLRFIGGASALPDHPVPIGRHQGSWRHRTVRSRRAGADAVARERTCLLAACGRLHNGARKEFGRVLSAGGGSDLLSTLDRVAAGAVEDHLLEPGRADDERVLPHPCVRIRSVA